MMHVDVLVIGLGPAGSAAASVAARAGLKVLAVERRKQVGVPVQCAEFIPSPLSKYAQTDGVLLQRITGMQSLLPSGEVEETQFPGLMIDRAAFDQALANEAERAGACLYLESSLIKLDPGNSWASVNTPQGQLEIEYKVLIAADGPHSTVADFLGLPKLEIVHTRQYTVPLKSSCTDTAVWLSGDYPGGYAWLFPKGGCANLGIGIDKRFAADLKTSLDALHRQLVDENRVGGAIGFRTGGAIPVGGLRERLVLDSVMFTGDAAGLTHPITGAGIAAAVISGERAGQAAAACLQDRDTNALADFEEDIRDQFESTLRRAVERRHWMNQYWKSAVAKQDAMHRKGWIAFPEYFSD